MNFLDKLKNVLDNEHNISVTENNALGYATSGKNLLDFHFAVSSLRSADETEILNRFIKAYYDDRVLAIKWLFYARDARSGLGERRLFRIILKELAINNSEIDMHTIIQLIPEYGRYDDLLVLLDTPWQDEVIELIKAQLFKDVIAQNSDEPISLLAKWLPSINTSSENTRRQAKLIASKLNMSDKEYRLMCSSLRKALGVIEVNMSANDFESIKYESVPSKANLIYRNAFLRHEPERRGAYLKALARGETTINAQVLYPYEIVSAYTTGRRLNSLDETLEQLWNALPEIESLKNTIVVQDGSGSMTVSVGNTHCSALDVAISLAIYASQHCVGPFKNRYLTFSMNPRYIDVSAGNNLHEKLQLAMAYNEIANTDIYKVFELILTTAKKHKMSQSEIPQNILIISDMEFDGCAKNADERLFEMIRKEYTKAGYMLPRLIFWNVNGRTNTIPVKENKLGVTLVSGFSINVFKMVVSNQLDPYLCLTEILNVDRYAAFDNIIKDNS